MQGKKKTFNGELGYYRVVLLKVTMHSKVRLLFIMHPAQPSEARLGGVHLIFWHIQICTRLLQGSCLRLLCILHAHISSNGSHFLTAGFLVY